MNLYQCDMDGIKMSVDYDVWLKEQLQDEEFRREYEVAEFEYALS